MNSLFLTLSGWFLRILGKVIEISKIGSGDFQARSVLAFQDFPYENFKWYDFGLFAILALIALLIAKLGDGNLSTVSFLLLGILITSFFEKKTPGLIVQVFLSNQIEKPA
jgi:ABC-type Fe3+-siderophore transport system permease subunit